MVERYIFTSAQNDTPVHLPTWRALKALAKHRGAEIVVSPFVYDTSTHDDEKAAEKRKRSDRTWADEVEPHLCWDRTKVTKGLQFCGELQILPTAKRPISGFESYTGRDSCIIPHAKFAMQSVASGKFEGTKLIYTTGTVTKRNYIQKKAGQLAQFHHGFGGLLVEVDDDGRWFCRQLNASENGTLYDLDVCVRGGRLTTGNRVEALVWGDAHVRRADPVVAELAWGKGGMLDALRPRHQIFHDVLDFYSRNHHEIYNGRARFERFCGAPEDDDVFLELIEVAKALNDRGREWCKSVVVASNHDGALSRWLDTADYRQDPRNARIFLALQKAVYDSIAEKRRDFSIFEHAMRVAGAPRNVKFLREDEDYIICKDANGGINLGMHGHLGVNGGKGSMIGFARSGRKSIVGHGHHAGIVDGAMMVGTSSQLDMGYNRGLSSWSHSHGVVYPNGKRALVTMWKGAWRAS